MQDLWRPFVFTKADVEEPQILEKTSTTSLACRSVSGAHTTISWRCSPYVVCPDNSNIYFSAAKQTFLIRTSNTQGFALAAALAQVSAPTDQNLINLLGLHVLLKSFVYYPAYLLDIAPVRSLAHLGATASVINVAWLLALGVK
jgi:hypothetical protein